MKTVKIYSKDLNEEFLSQLDSDTALEIHDNTYWNSNYKFLGTLIVYGSLHIECAERMTLGNITVYGNITVTGIDSDASFLVRSLSATRNILIYNLNTVTILHSTMVGMLGIEFRNVKNLQIKDTGCLKFVTKSLKLNRVTNSDSNYFVSQETLKYLAAAWKQTQHLARL